ncbi:DEHA2G23518p [Debaryomyces hansenii CBS767]|uniref:Ubiquitin-like modifier-activating enzyme ATG7 n=1 Tax=Debaryomyces hansenii (strain ATCC 36239 / CBS 767 / BCRC 21394 / JCM 1990 / NBRC 0083 / IGC 2968) TaxID=284592 RepID=ATG7_DEBHA|nr:DEHA2G23518p [Debaryomyces hansenii CBS767]Q6BGV9.2 RecName: Full=Ubiquitin-like modifier-activating enzyme ATG7; AltName: Full=ATG12-activating enzyme E1 ATG7; AltName: Full=Autophagy-related protein 7 [Debaryomyces hansenii CBS767]CAG91073.2 DEHA2G23518p [Debaryomyces hansenii CBS767]|eukprot:XP_462562.2 DEHA2G23518p [Debaryomyces hansenii CBS767]
MSSVSASTERKHIKFTPIQSFVESSFFTKLSELKLDEFKLDSTKKEIKGFLTHPKRLNKFNDYPTINFDYSSFDKGPDVNEDNNISWKGYIYNVNTIEEFKDIDKQAILKRWGTEIYNEIQDGSVDLSYECFNKVHVLAFCDLKKYKFYYWFAFPTLHSPWNIIGADGDSLKKFIPSIKEFVETSKFVQFFQINDGNIIERVSEFQESKIFVFIDTCLSQACTPSVQLKNYLYVLARKGFENIDLIIYRNNGNSFYWKLQLDKDKLGINEVPRISGWERLSNGKLGPRLADLGSLIDPQELAKQAVDLNLKLMKWRIAPNLDLDIIKNQRVLLLGAGTLGSYVSRALMGWGVRNITFVDNGRISYSNPVRQPLFSFKDCFSDEGQGEWKAIRAANTLKEIFPDVQSKGYNLEVPMIGHPVNNETKQKSSFDKLSDLFDDHDVVFLLMDSRESRWLPTVLGLAKNKIVLNAALGFDSFLVMRHGNISNANNDDTRVGCYYCNDVVAPNDSLSDRTLDQMCTVTRPGVALMASSLAVELFISMLQHPNKQYAEPGPSNNLILGEVPHQIRGFLHNYSQSKLQTPNYKHCSACSKYVIDKFNELGWEFVKNCLNDVTYLEETCGLLKVQQEADLASSELLKDLELSDDDDSEWLD